MNDFRISSETENNRPNFRLNKSAPEDVFRNCGVCSTGLLRIVLYQSASGSGITEPVERDSIGR